MAHANNTRSGNVHQKTTRSMMSIGIQSSNAANFQDDSNNYLVGYLPADAIVTDAYCFVAGTDATAATLTIGTAEGGSEILGGVDLTASGKQGTFPGAVATDTGLPVYVALGGKITTAKVVVNIHYDEYLLTTGELTLID